MLRRLLCPLAVATATVCAAATPAHAEPTTPGVSYPRMDIDITYIAGGHHVCGSGAVRGTPPTLQPGMWELRIEGGTSEPWPILYSSGGLGPTFADCYDVWKYQGAYGQYVVTLRYTGVGDDVSSVIAGSGTWTPDGDNSITMHR